MSYRKLLKAAANLGSPKVLLVGDFMLDSYVYGDALRISPEAPVQVLKVVKREHAGGGASSVAADITTLGAACICIGMTGTDRNGQLLREILQKTGASIDGLLEAADRPTITKERVIGLAQHRHRQQLLRVDEECTDPPAKAVRSPWNQPPPGGPSGSPKSPSSARSWRRRSGWRFAPAPLLHHEDLSGQTPFHGPAEGQAHGFVGTCTWPGKKPSKR